MDERDPIEDIVDAHAHLDFPEFESERENAFARARAAGVRGFVIAGYAPSTFARAAALRSDSVVVAAGLHPWALAEQPESEDEAALVSLATLAASPEAEGIGELGLDAALARRAPVPITRQTHVARAGLAIAAHAGKPLVLHVVGAHAAMHALVDEAGPLPLRMVHGFTGSAELARAWVRRETFVSFGASVLAPRNRHAREAARVVPLEWLLVESDAPAGSTRKDGRTTAGPAREPAVVREVVSALALLRGESPHRIAEATAANARRLFPRLGTPNAAPAIGPIAPTRPQC